jgi:hypothetical protein
MSEFKNILASPIAPYVVLGGVAVTVLAVGLPAIVDGIGKLFGAGPTLAKDLGKTVSAVGLSAGNAALDMTSAALELGGKTIGTAAQTVLGSPASQIPEHRTTGDAVCGLFTEGDRALSDMWDVLF